MAHFTIETTSILKATSIGSQMEMPAIIAVLELVIQLSTGLSAVDISQDDSFANATTQVSRRMHMYVFFFYQLIRNVKTEEHKYTHDHKRVPCSALLFLSMQFLMDFTVSQSSCPTPASQAALSSAIQASSIGPIAEDISLSVCAKKTGKK